jgi:HPt (histidine-containing phosphotransfer) domain-containing protein
MAAAPDRARVDLDRLACLREIDPQLPLDMFVAFHDDLRRSLPMLVLHTLNRDWEGAQALAHRLKGAAASLGAIALWDHLEEVESTARAGVVTGQQLEDLELELDASLRALRQTLM